VASEADVSWMVAFAEEEFGGLDALVNNAGAVAEPYFPESEPEHWGHAIDLNLRGVMLGIHFGVRAMNKRASGVIVNVSSIGGIGFKPYDKPASTVRPRRGWCVSPLHWLLSRRKWASASTASARAGWTPWLPDALAPRWHLKSGKSSCPYRSGPRRSPRPS
jgi:NAD(P)-dependent dehydrogenase (short-subunit alcohol dehydrogenase family)